MEPQMQMEWQIAEAQEKEVYIVKRNIAFKQPIELESISVLPKC